MLNGDTQILNTLAAEEERFQGLWDTITQQRSLVSHDQQWLKALEALETFFALFMDYHQLAYRYFVKRGSASAVSDHSISEHLTRYIDRLDVVQEWTERNNFTVGGKAYAARHCKSALSFAEIREDAQQTVAAVLTEQNAVPG